MHLVIPHAFSQQDAVAKVKTMLAEAKSKVSETATIDKEDWQGNTLNFAFTAQGQSISGTVAVEPNQFVIDAQLPMMLRLFEGKIEKAIQDQAAKMLG